MKAIHALAGVACGLLCLSAEADNPAAPTDTAKLVGTYKIVAGEKNGQKIAADQLNEVSVRIAKNAITTYDKSEKEIYVATYEIDTNKRPWHIMMTATLAPGDGKGTKAPGLIEMDGETVKLIYALPGGEQPREFKTGDKQQMFVMRQTDRLAERPAPKK